MKGGLAWKAELAVALNDFPFIDEAFQYHELSFGKSGFDVALAFEACAVVPTHDFDSKFLSSERTLFEFGGDFAKGSIEFRIVGRRERTDGDEGGSGENG